MALLPESPSSSSSSRYLQDMSALDSYQHAVPSTIDLYTQTGRLNNIIVRTLDRVFFVTLDRGSLYPGILRYNQELDLDGPGIAIIGISSDNKLTVTMTKGGSTQPIALFTSTDDAPSPHPPQIQNAGQWQHVISISHNMSTYEDWKAKATMVANLVPPDVPDSLLKKRRWLQIILRNETDFDLRLMGSYFGWGRYEQTPAPRLTSFSMDTFTACVGDGTVFTGVAGATTYQINMGIGHQFDFGMGYSNPYIGPFKVGLLATNDPQKAYDVTTSATDSLTSTITYAAKEGGSGRTFLFRLHISATAGQKPEFIITEDRFYSAALDMD